MPQKKFHIITLGCKVNQYESEALREAWLAAGHIEQSGPDGADLVLLNSCAITAKAVSDLRALARRVRAAAPACELLITGCAAQALPGELQELPVDGLVPQSDKLSLLRWLGPVQEQGLEQPDALLSGAGAANAGGGPTTGGVLNPASARASSPTPTAAPAEDSIAPVRGNIAERNLATAAPTEQGIDPGVHFALLNLAHSGPDRLQDTSAQGLRNFWANAAPEEEASGPRSGFPAFSISNYARSRAVLKIHDGCSQHCTYCIVPQGRGPSVSRPWAETLAEAGRLIDAGFREIVINGVNLRQYGADLAAPEDFWDLLTRLEAAFAPEWAGRLRFRISSLEPGQLNRKALETLGKSRLVAPQLHLSLQSGSPHTLKRMGRGHYNLEGIADFLAELAQSWPLFGLGADFIAGFPGESEEHFAETLALAQKLPLSYAHVFPYSKRPGTAAAKLTGQLGPTVKKERAARLRALVKDKQQDFLQRQLELPQVLVALEDGRHERTRGVNEFYTDCKFSSPVRENGKTLIAARPVALEKQLLIVEKI